MPTEVCIVKAMIFSSSYIRMWELNHNEGWATKNGCFWTAVLGKNLESPLDCKEIKPVNPKGSQSWIFIGRTDAESWSSNFGHLIDAKSSLEKTLMLGKIEGRRRGRQRMRWLDGITDSKDIWVWANSGRWWRTGRPGMLQSMGSQRVGHNWVTEQQHLLPVAAVINYHRSSGLRRLKCMIALEVRNEPSKHHQAWVPSRGFEEEPFLAWTAYRSHLCPSPRGPFSYHWSLLLLSSYPNCCQVSFFAFLATPPQLAGWSSVPGPGTTEPGPLQRRCWVLTTGPQGLPGFLLVRILAVNSGPIWIIHNNLFILKVLNLITAAKSFPPCKVTSSQFWTWGHGCFQRGKGHYLAFIIRGHGGQAK